jgi:hypothetical protein
MDAVASLQQEKAHFEAQAKQEPELEKSFLQAAESVTYQRRVPKRKQDDKAEEKESSSSESE